MPDGDLRDAVKPSKPWLLTRPVTGLGGLTSSVWPEYSVGESALKLSVLFRYGTMASGGRIAVVITPVGPYL